MKELAGIERCFHCGRSAGAMRAGASMCHRCERELDPTPLQVWAHAASMKLEDLAALAGVSRRSVMRAAAGDRVSSEVASRLEQATRIPARTFTTDARNG